MQEFVIEFLNKFGYLGVSLLIAIENVFPPIPSEIILTFGGFMTTYTNMKVWSVILASTIGAVAGAIVLYSVGRLLSPERLNKILSGKVGKVLHLKSDDINKAVKWFDKKGYFTVLICRCIPIVRSLISIPAGTAKMNLGVFLLLTTLGTTVWNTILVWLGAFAGESWSIVAEYFDTYSTVTLIVIILAVLVAGVVFYKKRVKKNVRE